MLVDYAYPTMMAEKCVKGVHDAFLDRKLERAEEQAQEAIKWLVEVRIALRKAREDAKD